MFWWRLRNLAPYLAVFAVSDKSTLLRCSLGETKGGPNALMSAEMTESKFSEATSLSLPAASARQLLERLRRVEDVTDVNHLFD